MQPWRFFQDEEPLALAEWDFRKSSPTPPPKKKNPAVQVEITVSNHLDISKYKIHS